MRALSWRRQPLICHTGTEGEGGRPAAMKHDATNVSLGEVTFLDPDVQENPFPVYERLLAQAPVFYDAQAGFYVITRYADVRMILTDPVRFSSAATIERMRETLAPERARRAQEIYEREGWLPAPTLSLLDPPRHKAVRAIFVKALRAGMVSALDPLVERYAYALVDDFAASGTCDVVQALCVPLPLMAICSQVGVPIDDIWRIKRWTDAWVRRFSMMQSVEEEEASIREEIAFQHYFRDVVENLRLQPNGSILSDLVNTRLDDGSRLTYGEIVSHLLSDIFVGGSETATNAMSEGVLHLCRNADVYARLMSNLDVHLPRFVEESLRLQSPVQGLYRVTTCEVELHGVTLPAGALLNLRFAAANRDETQFAGAHQFDLERGNAGAHLAFGSGIHHCVGAPLARRELYWGYSALLRRCRNIRLADDRAPTHVPGLMLRAMRSLHIAFDS